MHADDPTLIEVAERLLNLHKNAVNAPPSEQATEADIVRAVCDLLVASGSVDRNDIRLEADRNDIRTGDLIIEVKKRIGMGIIPDSRHVDQLDGYLERARESGQPERLGILSDGKHWVLRQPGVTEVRTVEPYAFTLRAPTGAIDLVVWLRDETHALPHTSQAPSPDVIASAFGTSVSAEALLAELGRLHDSHRDDPTVSVKRDLWRNLLAAALGEVINHEADLDRLFVRHTYLSTIVALAVQAAFQIDICSRRPADLINGLAFIEETGVRGVIESDFFGWPAETEVGREWIAALVRRVDRFDWTNTDYDVARVLYQAVIGADDRKRLGEYYTPDWLACAIVEEVVDDPLSQRVLDPACGSGTFLRAAITSYIEVAETAGFSADQTLSGLRERVAGIDIHPVAVHLARATWVLAAKNVIAGADEVGSLTVPVYLGDSLQLLADPGSDEGRVDRIVGNPPWLTYSRAEATVRDELERQSKTVYKIWVGGKYAPHQDMAGLFYTRSLDLYLREGGRVGMVLPHSALAAGQYEKWRTGVWRETAADLSTEPWDLEKIEPNTFFPMAACVVFASKAASAPERLPLTASRWLGPEGGPNSREQIPLADTAARFVSPYGERAAQGASLVPRVLFFVHRAKSAAALAKGLMRIEPMRSAQEKAPWKALNPPELAGVIEDVHVHRVHRGDTVGPFVLFEPHHAVLPLRGGDTAASWPGDERAIHGVDPAGLEYRMRSRWQAMSSLWDGHKSPNTRLSLVEQLDYRSKLSRQLASRPIRLVYTTSGRPTAAVLTDSEALVDTSLYWLACDGLAEAFYLQALINSQTLYAAVAPLMPKGQFGERHLHKHLWRLPIGVYDHADPTHRALAAAGSTAADHAADALSEVQETRQAAGLDTAVRVARKTLRGWLDASDVGQAIEAHVETLLSRAF